MPSIDPTWVSSSSSPGTPNVIESALQAGIDQQLAQAALIGTEGMAPAILQRQGFNLQELEHLLAAPLRRRAQATFEDVKSFCQYVKDFRSACILTGCRASGRVIAVLDYHGAGKDGKPSWCEHTATLELAKATEWIEWMGHHRRALPQVQFAEFIEDHLADVVEPDAAVLSEAAKHLEATRNVEFKSGVSLRDGSVQFKYEETVAERGKGSLTIPAAFIIGIPVYEHGEKFRVDAKLRYRIGTDGKLSFTYVLDRPERVEKSAFDATLAGISEALGQPVLLGRLHPNQ